MNTPLVIRTSREAAREIYRQLVLADRDDTISIALLNGGVTTLVRDTGESVGIEFIAKHPHVFARLVPRAARSDFWRNLLEVRDIVRLFTNTTLLRQLDRDDATNLMREVFNRHPMPDCSWIRATCDADLDMCDIKNVVLAQLEDREWFDNSSLQEFARSLVLTGAGGIREAHLYWTGRGQVPLHAADHSSAWWALRFDRKHDWLFDILTLCAERCPQAFFAPREERTGCSTLDKLTSLEPMVGMFSSACTPKPYFSGNQALALVKRAAAHLTSFDGVCNEALGELPVASRRELAMRAVPGSLVFIVRTALKDAGARKNILARVMKCMPEDGQEILGVYRDLHDDLHSPRAAENQFAKEVTTFLQRALYLTGIPVGVLQHRRTEHEGSQYFIEITDPDTGKTICYIRRDYHPRGLVSKHYPVGTLVFVDPRLACNQPHKDRNKVRVIFTPVSRRTERSAR